MFKIKNDSIGSYKNRLSNLSKNRKRNQNKTMGANSKNSFNLTFPKNGSKSSIRDLMKKNIKTFVARIELNKEDN